MGYPDSTMRRFVSMPSSALYSLLLVFCFHFLPHLCCNLIEFVHLSSPLLAISFPHLPFQIEIHKLIVISGREVCEH